MKSLKKRKTGAKVLVLRKKLSSASRGSKFSDTRSQQPIETFVKNNFTANFNQQDENEELNNRTVADLSDSEDEIGFGGNVMLHGIQEIDELNQS